MVYITAVSSPNKGLLLVFSSVHPAAPPPPPLALLLISSPPPSPSLWCGTAPSARPPDGGANTAHTQSTASCLKTVTLTGLPHSFGLSIKAMQLTFFCHVCAHLWRHCSIHFCTCNSIRFWFIPIKHLFHTQSALYVNPQHGNFLPTESAVSGLKLKMHMECPLEMHLETQPSALFCPLTAANQTGAFSAVRQRSGGREAQHMEVWRSVCTPDKENEKLLSTMAHRLQPEQKTKTERRCGVCVCVKIMKTSPWFGRRCLALPRAEAR